MITKWVSHLHRFECDLFISMNSHFDRKRLYVFFSQVTHLGGAWLTISLTLLTILLLEMPHKVWGVQSALALATSHLFVVFMKKIYPRNRPYLSVKDTKVVPNPLKDHSFPSGHTTAIFSIITPFIIHMPILSILLYPVAICVGLSRVFLGLHYPSDVLVGALTGMTFAYFIVLLV